MSNQTFKAGDRVEVFTRGIPTLKNEWLDGYLVESGIADYNGGGLWIIREDGLRVCARIEHVRHVSAPYPEYAADLATYRDAVAAGAQQGQTGRDAALLRLIGHLLGEGGGK